MIQTNKSIIKRIKDLENEFIEMGLVAQMTVFNFKRGDLRDMSLNELINYEEDITGSLSLMNQKDREYFKLNGKGFHPDFCKYENYMRIALKHLNRELTLRKFVYGEERRIER